MHEYMHGINTHPQFMVLAETSTLGFSVAEMSVAEMS